MKGGIGKPNPLSYVYNMNKLEHIVKMAIDNVYMLGGMRQNREDDDRYKDKMVAMILNAVEEQEKEIENQK
jgi:hypothetical protein